MRSISRQIFQIFIRLPLTWDHLAGTCPPGSLLCTAGEHTNTGQCVSGTTSWRRFRGSDKSNMLLTGGTNCDETTEKEAASKSRTQRPILENSTSLSVVWQTPFFLKSAETVSVYLVTTVSFQRSEVEPEVNTRHDGHEYAKKEVTIYYLSFLKDLEIFRLQTNFRHGKW